MDGQVIMGGALPDQDVFRDVTIYLFSENGTLIRSHVAGDLRRPLNVTLTTDQIPHYVIIDSSDFWTEDDINVRYYLCIDVNRSEDYGQSEVQSRDGVPVSFPARNISEP